MIGRKIMKKLMKVFKKMEKIIVGCDEFLEKYG